MSRTSGRERKYRPYNCRVDTVPVSSKSRWCCVGISLFALFAALAFVWLQSDQQRTYKELQKIQHKLFLKGKEVENLGMQLEGYTSGKYVLTTVDRLGLNLRPPVRGQVCRVSRGVSREERGGINSMLARK